MTFLPAILRVGFPGSSADKNPPAVWWDLSSIPVLGRSPGEGKGYPLQYSGLENSMDRGAWQAAVYGFAKSRTRLSDWATQHYTFRVKNKAALFLLFPPWCPLPRGRGCSSEQSSIFMSRNRMTDVLELHVITLFSGWEWGASQEAQPCSGPAPLAVGVTGQLR